MKTNLIYITAGSIEEAKNIGNELVSTRLAACANIIERVHSTDWWEGEVQNDDEVIVVAKTTEPLVPKVIEKVKSVHSYEVPCVVSLPILDGNSAFLDWIAEETRSAGVSE